MAQISDSEKRANSESVSSGVEQVQKVSQKTLEIPCIRFKQNNKFMFTGSIKLKDLFAIEPQVAVFHVRTENTPQEGYQREVEPIRANKFAKFITEGNISPASILLAIRNVDIEKKARVINSNPAQVSGSKIHNVDNVLLEIDLECPVYVVDGQHRLRGLSNCDVEGKLANFELPFTLLWGLDKFEEANQFVILNKTQKAVRTDLAERFVAEAVRKRGVDSVVHDPNTTIFKHAAWIGLALDVLDTIIEPERKTVWADKLKLPNEPKAKNLTVSQSAFTNSMQPLLDKLGPMNNRDLYNTCKIVEILDAFWNAVKKNCPKPFELYSDVHNPNDYAIQQTIGVMSLHRLLATLYNYLPGVLNTHHFEELLAVDGIKNVSYWDRTIQNKDTTALGGKWTMMGTNMKSFRIISDNIMEEIKDTKMYHELISKVKSNLASGK